MAITRRSVLLWVALAMVVVMSAASAVTGSRRVLLGGLDIIPASMASNPPDVFLNFSTNQAQKKTSVTSASSLLTVSRASSGTVNDSNGNWTSVASNRPRLSNLGLLVEEARTNAIRNNSMAGAVVMADGVELTTNGTFTPAGGAGWTAVLGGGGSFDFSVAGQVTVSGTAANNSTYIYQQITGLVVGRNYVIKITGPNSGNFFVGTTPGGVDVLNFSNVIGNGAGSNVGDRVGFTATATTLYVSLSGGSAATKTWTSVSVQDGERVQNGGFTSNPLSASQGVIQNGWQWTRAGTSAPTFSSGVVTLTVDATGDVVNLIGAAIPTVAGCTYTLSVDIGGASPNLVARAGSTSTGFDLFNKNGVTSGAGQKFQFTATTATTFITFISTTANAVSTIANVSVQSAGALPTNWVGQNLPELQATIVGVGVQKGVNYIDYRVAGTPASTSQKLFMQFEPSGVATSSYGQTWSQSGFFALVGGSLTNIGSLQSQFSEATGGIQYGSVILNAVITSTLTRYSNSATPLTAANTSLIPRVLFGLTSGQPIDATIRIGWPQFENNPLINSTVASAATAASGASGVNGSAVYSVGGGTGTAATLNVTWAAGVMTVNSVASAGNYSVFPPSPAALTYVSGTATGWTGATVTLTPTNNAALAFATSPIVTSSSAATRASDNVTITSPPTFGSAHSLFSLVTFQAPAGYPQNNALIVPNDGTTNNREVWYRTPTTANIGLAVFTSGSNLGGPSVAGPVSSNVSHKLAYALAPSDIASVLDAGSPATSVSIASTPSGLNNVWLGYSSVGAGFLNGFMAQAAIWASQRVPNAQLQSMTQ